MYLCVYVYMDVRLHVFMYVSVYVCAHGRTFACMHVVIVCMYVYKYKRLTKLLACRSRLELTSSGIHIRKCDQFGMTFVA